MIPDTDSELAELEQRVAAANKKLAQLTECLTDATRELGAESANPSPPPANERKP